MIQRLVTVDKLENSSYNPRRAEPQRLAMVELSLRKLGFLIPICINSKGEILSGNQRFSVATQMMGATKVPVMIAPPMEDIDEKTVNVLFNRATNDMNRDTDSKEMAKQLAETDLDALCEGIPDIEVDTPEWYPCLRTKEVSMKALVKKNVEDFTQYAKNTSSLLRKYGITMPIVISTDGKVINGIGRLHDMDSSPRYTSKKVEVVVISKEKAALAKHMLNLLSMDFVLHEDYKDILRAQSYMRPYTTRPGLAVGMYVDAFPHKSSKEMKFIDDETARKWKEVYGNTVIDFGAGKLVNTNILRDIGVDCTPMEPFPMESSISRQGSKKVSRERAIKIASKFLDTIETGKRFDTIFVASVFNSVPFKEDRRKIATICAALCDPMTTVHFFTMSTQNTGWRGLGSDSRNITASRSAGFAFDYEPGTVLQSFHTKMKIQKYHTPEELHAVAEGLFKKISIKPVQGANLLAKCKYGQITREQIDEALEFEFNLKYPDGERMGLGERAREAFNNRFELNEKLGYVVPQ